jgi:hypothetical protein
VPRLVCRAALAENIAEIAGYIERERQSRAVADSFVDKLTDYCEHIARLPGPASNPYSNGPATVDSARQAISISDGGSERSVHNIRFY